MLKKLLYSVLLAAAFTSGFFALWSKGWLDRWEYPTWTWRIMARAKPAAATHDIKVIVLDQSSLDWAANEMGLSWPWPREVYVPIIEFAKRGGARAIAFDVLYTEDSAYGVEDDALFGEAIRKGPPFTAALFIGTGIGRFDAWPDYAPDRHLQINGLDEWLAAADRGDRVTPRATLPIREVSENATVLADVKGSADRDGIIRRTHLFSVFDGRAIPSLGLAAYLAESYGPGKRRMGAMQISEGWLTIGRRKIQIDQFGQAILKYRGPSGTHEKYTAAQVIQSELRMQAGERPALSPVVFNNSYVFLGFSAPGLLDLRPTPLSPVTPGVEVHTTALDNFLANDFIRLPPPKLVAAATMLLVFVATFIVFISKKAWQVMIGVAVFLIIPWLLGFALYDFSYWWPIMFQSLTLISSMSGAVLVNYATEGRQKAFIKNAFKHYLSPAVIEQIMANPDQLKLGGERRCLSIFFSDLAGFSTISEKLEPQALTQLLNDYLTDMTDIILEEGGTLDKYEGDAIIAFWNAPLHQQDHALRAARTALRCQRKLAERRAEFEQRSGVVLSMRIGVNTGDVVVGNMGSRERFDYTVLGDAANLAARLEGANKYFGTATMIAESTWVHGGNALVGREIGRITVVGRRTPERVYEVLGMPGESASVPVDEFERGIRLCESGQWQEAAIIFEQWPHDALSCRYASRCRELCSSPTAAWDGVWNLAEK